MDQTHPPAEVEVDERLAAALISEQCPELDGLRPVLADEGWDNFTFRLGDALALRIPRREVAVELLLNEQRWLPTIADWIDVLVPRPIVLGTPSELFPWSWSVVEWIEGRTPDDRPLDETAATAMARVLRSLHRPAPADAPANPFRGLPLRERDEVVRARLDRLAMPHLELLWARALQAAPSTDHVWLHGDLHPRNVVVESGQLRGILDWGDLCGGDRATDLACAWTLFETPGREAFLDAYPHEPADLARAAGWAVNYGSGLLESGEPRHVPIGEDIVRRLLETAMTLR